MRDWTGSRSRISLRSIRAALAALSERDFVIRAGLRRSQLLCGPFNLLTLTPGWKSIPPLLRLVEPIKYPIDSLLKRLYFIVDRPAGSRSFDSKSKEGLCTGPIAIDFSRKSVELIEKRLSLVFWQDYLIELVTYRADELVDRLPRVRVEQNYVLSLGFDAPRRFNADFLRGNFRMPAKSWKKSEN